MAKQIKTKTNTEETVDAKTVNLMRLLGRKIVFRDLGDDQGKYTVKAASEKFAICTKPFNPQRTVIYTIIDQKYGYRNRNSFVFNPYDYKIQADIDKCLEDLQKGECEISSRGDIELCGLTILSP